MDVSFIIPVFNQLKYTLECLRSLQETVKAHAYEIILVDDGSQLETRQALRKLTNDKIKLIENSRNMGYAHSNNIGAHHSRGKYLFLLNNDLELLPNWFEPMLKAFDKIENLGLVGNVQLNAQTGKIDHAGIYVSLDATINHNHKVNRGPLGTPAYSRSHMITAACCALPRSLFMKIGGFDEAFVNGGEDIDLCFRIRKLGYRIAVANKSVIKHHVSATRSGRNLNTEINSRLLQRKWASMIAQHAASNWPESYLRTFRSPSTWVSIDRSLLRDALSRYLFIKKGPAPAGLKIAKCSMELKERHWRTILDGWSDEMTKAEERNKHASPLQDSYEYYGLHSEEDRDGVWIRENAQITLPRGTVIYNLSIKGHVYPPDTQKPEEQGKLGLAITINACGTKTFLPLVEGNFTAKYPLPPAPANEPISIELTLLGTSRSNTFAYLGRLFAKKTFIPATLRSWFSKYRAQRLNKRLCIESLSVNDEEVFNFALNPTNPLNTDYALKQATLGVNLVGWFKAELGIGESARIAAKALKASKLPYALIPLKVNCLASQGDNSLDSQFVENNPFPINVFHIDAPQSPDIDHYHGIEFRKGRRNIAYWAWELPDFPDKWIKYFRYFDEIWTPSNFVRDAIALKSPVPVITVPHCIDFEVPNRDYRKELGLPSDKFLFCFAYDLNSYQERKNPKAAIEAFRIAFSDSEYADKVGLVIKIHSTENNQDNYKELLGLLEETPNYYLIDRTLSREDTYGLMQASDCYVSLHRSEGFGLTVAESMFLGKPVISTNWSATSEFVNAQNGCPVSFKLIQLERDFGPYEKGQFWADPDPNDAARHMRELVANPEHAAELGRQAKETITQLYSPERISTLYRNRLRAMVLWLSKPET